MLYFAAFLLVAIAVVHSVLGERYILMRLFRRGNMPKTLGSAKFTEATLRFAWHLTSVAWLGFAAVLVHLANPPVRPEALGWILGATFLVHGLVALVGSRGRHLSWVVFFAVGAIAIVASSS